MLPRLLSDQPSLQRRHYLMWLRGSNPRFSSDAKAISAGANLFAVDDNACRTRAALNISRRVLRTFALVAVWIWANAAEGSCIIDRRSADVILTERASNASTIALISTPKETEMDPVYRPSLVLQVWKGKLPREINFGADLHDPYQARRAFRSWFGESCGMKTRPSTGGQPDFRICGDSGTCPTVHPA